MDSAFGTADIVIYPARNRLIGLAVGCAVCLGIIWFYSPQSSDDHVVRLKTWIATVMGLPVFSIGFLYFVWRIVYPQAVVVADGQGLTLNGIFLGPGRLGWNEIAGLRVGVVRGQRMLTVELHDGENVLARMPGVVRVWAKLNRAIWGKAFYLPQMMVEYSLDGLIVELEQRRAGFEMQYRNAA